jgi:hypothetical protein
MPLMRHCTAIVYFSRAAVQQLTVLTSWNVCNYTCSSNVGQCCCKLLLYTLVPRKALARAATAYITKPCHNDVTYHHRRTLDDEHMLRARCATTRPWTELVHQLRCVVLRQHWHNVRHNTTWDCCLSKRRRQHACVSAIRSNIWCIAPDTQ